MKEKIIKILESQFSVVEYEDPDTGFTESTTIDVLTTDEFPDIVDKLEILINQEVERRIAERMEKITDDEIVHEIKNDLKNTHNIMSSKSHILMRIALTRLRSRLAKTEGGGE